VTGFKISKASLFSHEGNLTGQNRKTTIKKPKQDYVTKEMIKDLEMLKD